MINLNRLNQEKYEQIIKKLKDKKIRLTEIRSLIIKLLIVSEHLTIQQIIESLKIKLKNINIMSVYNTMDLLLNEHIVYANTFNGKNIWYEILEDKSVHLKCDICNEVIHLDEEKNLDYKFQELFEIAKNNKIKLNHFKIEGHGYCFNCLKNNK